MDGVVDVRAELGIIARLWAMTATLRDMKSIAIGAAAFASRKAVPADKRTPGTSAEVEPWFRTNVGLIQSMEQETLKEIDTLIVEGFEEGMSTDAIASEMRRRFGVAKSRARFIARNEIGNLNAAVNKERQQQAGGRRYYWRTSKDERVRPLHAAREGQVFDWDNPPEGGHAGEDHNCRCYPEYIPED